jgi:hypothetical protein
MSTKTNFKRVALVAVASLGLGVLTSVAPAFAVAYTLESGITAATTDVGLTVGLAAAGANIPYAGVCDAGAPAVSTTPRTVAVGGSSAVKVIRELAADTITTGELRITGPAEFTGGTLGYVGSTSKTFTVSALSAGTAADDAFYANVKITGTGIVRIDAFASDVDTSVLANSGVKVYSLFILGVTSCGSGVSAATSYSQLVSIDSQFLTLAQVATGRSTGAWAATGARTNNAAGLMTNSQNEETTYANAATAYIAVNANNAQGYAYTTSSNAVVQCTNKATIEATTGGYFVKTSFAGFDTFAITQPTANAPLDTTCTVSVDGVVFATKTIKFLGDAASVNLVHYKSGNAEASSSATTDGQLIYTILDSAGNELTEAATPALTTASTTTRINTISATAYTAVGANDSYDNSYGIALYNCLDYGTQDLAVKITNTALNSITSNTVSAHCGGAVNTYTAAFDKAQYQTGDIATLTITAKDYAAGTTWTGTTVGSGTYGTFSVAVGGMTPVATPVSTDINTTRNTGVWTYSYKVDTTTGSYVAQVVVPVKSSTSANYNKASLLQYKIVSSDGGVSNADVLKAIVSLIASINKQIAALQKALLKK